MRLSHVLAGGLLLALLAARLEAGPAPRPPHKPGRSAAGQEPAETPAERGGGGGGEAGGRGRGSRLLRELRADTKSRAAWARLREQPASRRHKGLSKKGLSKGCFGLKLDRIGSMSGLGC